MVAIHKESESGGLECGNCDSGDPPVNKCTTCLHFLCEFCTQAHRRGRGTSSHSLISLEEAKNMGCEAVKKQLFCKEHEGEMMKLFCETCEEAICRDCTIVKHRDHKYTFVKDAFSKRKESLMAFLSETKTKSSKLKEALDRVSDMKTSIHSCAEQTVQKIVKGFDELRALINTRRLELIRDVENLKEAKLTSLELQQQELETAQGCVQSGVEFTEKAFENGSEVEILNMHRQVITRLQELNAVQLKLEPCVDNVFTLRDDKVSRELEHEIAKFCVVTDTVAHAGMSTVTMGHAQEGVMYNTLCGQPVEFKITARKESGTIITEGGDIFDVQVYSKEAENLVASMKVRPCSENGSYCFSHTPEKEGHYTLSVMLDDHHIQGSPFMWFVEKWKLTQPFSSGNNQIHIQLSEECLTATCSCVAYTEVLPSGFHFGSSNTSKRSPSSGSIGTLLGVSASASLGGVTFAATTQASSFCSTSTSSLFGASAGAGSSTGGVSTSGTPFATGGLLGSYTDSSQFGSATCPPKLSTGFGTSVLLGTPVKSSSGPPQFGSATCPPKLSTSFGTSVLLGTPVKSSSGPPQFGSATCPPKLSTGFGTSVLLGTPVKSSSGPPQFGSATCPPKLSTGFGTSVLLGTPVKSSSGPPQFGSATCPPKLSTSFGTSVLLGTPVKSSSGPPQFGSATCPPKLSTGFGTSVLLGTPVKSSSGPPQFGSATCPPKLSTSFGTSVLLGTPVKSSSGPPQFGSATCPPKLSTGFGTSVLLGTPVKSSSGPPQFGSATCPPKLSTGFGTSVLLGTPVKSSSGSPQFGSATCPPKLSTGFGTSVLLGTPVKSSSGSPQFGSTTCPPKLSTSFGTSALLGTPVKSSSGSPQFGSATCPPKLSTGFGTSALLSTPVKSSSGSPQFGSATCPPKLSTGFGTSVLLGTPVKSSSGSSQFGSATSPPTLIASLGTPVKSSSGFSQFGSATGPPTLSTSFGTPVLLSTPVKFVSCSPQFGSATCPPTYFSTFGTPVTASGLLADSATSPTTSGLSIIGASKCAICGFFGSTACSSCGSSVNTASTCSNCGLFGTGACSNCRSVHSSGTIAQSGHRSVFSFSPPGSNPSTGGTPTVGFAAGKHTWKVQIYGKIMDGISLGLINASRQPNGKRIKLQKWWAWNSKQKQYPLLSGDQSATESTITHCTSGDIIELYLDCEEGTLKMFNQRTKQSDTWIGVQGEVLPAFCMASHGDKVSLIMQ